MNSCNLWISLVLYVSCDIFYKLVLHLIRVLHFRSFTGILLLVMFWLEKEKPVK